MHKKLNIAFLWHMHQPLYKDPLTSEYVLPWALLHGTKDYYDMAAILDEFPQIHQTFNIVPSLIEQINDYAGGRADDAYRKASLKAPSELSRTEKAFILKNFFQANWDNMIRPRHRYWELLRKRGASNEPDAIEAALRYFSDQDYLDLQTLFNLVWIDPEIVRRDKFLSALIGKGKGYSEEDKRALLDKQIEIIRRILPKYKELADKGIIELTTSPYYHPIMPLLYDSASAKVAMPDISMPKRRFSHPEDALTQLEKGIALFEAAFGRRPNGLWPPEGSVSFEILPIISGKGIKWIATDEEILSNTIKRPVRRDSSGNSYDSFLYKPYTSDTGGSTLSLFFRDHVISDRIGFDYAKMPPEAAAEDLVARLVHIRTLLSEPQNHIVPIILDGENAWENYRNDGRDFLTALYSRLSADPHLSCVTFSEFIERGNLRGSESLQWLYSGSWINHNFKVWIGHPEDNTAWDYINDARSALAGYEASLEPAGASEKDVNDIKAAWEEVYALEGSDWFWWYGEEHSSMSDEQFDSLFRRHLKRLYTLIKLEPPAYLDVSILSEERGVRPAALPTSYIRPSIDGEITNYFEWLSSGRLQRVYCGVSMHREAYGAGLIECAYYGFSSDEFFFRLDYMPKLIPYEKEWRFTMEFIYPGRVRIRGRVKGKDAAAFVYSKPDGAERWDDAGGLKDIASGRVVEFAVPFSTLGVKKGDEVRFFIDIDAAEDGVERWPAKGCLILPAPTEDFEHENWFV